MKQLDLCGAAEHRLHQLTVALEYPGRRAENTGQNLYPYRTPLCSTRGGRRGVFDEVHSA